MRAEQLQRAHSAQEELPRWTSDLLLYGICETSQGRFSGFSLRFGLGVTVGRMVDTTFFFVRCLKRNLEHLQYFPALDSFNVHLGSVQCTQS